MLTQGLWCFCSLLGVIIIVIGFYSFMWGKAKDEKKNHSGQFASLQSPAQEAPLLGLDAEER